MRQARLSFVLRLSPRHVTTGGNSHHSCDSRRQHRAEPVGRRPIVCGARHCDAATAAAATLVLSLDRSIRDLDVTAETQEEETRRVIELVGTAA